MFMSGPAQRRGARSTQSGTSTQQAQGIGGINPKEVDLETTAPVRAIKKRKVHSIIGSTNSSGLLIQGSYEHALESADNPEGANPPADSKSFRSPDFPISYSGLGVPKFVSPIRIASVDESLSISNNLSVNNNVDIGGSLSVGGTPVMGLDPNDFMKIAVDNTALGVQNFTKNEESTSPTTGAVRITGGLGVGFNAFIGGSINVGVNVIVEGGILIADQLLSTSLDNSTSVGTGAFVTDGGVGIAKDLFIGGKVDISSDEDANAGGTLGALIVDGGVSIAKKLFVAGVEVTPHPVFDHSVFMANNSDNDNVTGEQHFTNSTNATSTSVAAITTLGGVGIAQDMHLGGNLVMNGSTISGATIGNNFSTGILSGGLMAIVDTTHFSIVDGSGTVVDASNPLNVSTTPVTWSGFTNVLVATPSSESTFVYIDSTGSVVQSIVDPTPELRRNGILLGKLFTPAANGNDLILINNRPESFSSPANKSTDFIFALGPVVLKGLRISANGANLLLDRSAGDMHQEGINWHTNKQNPNIKAFVGLTGISFSRSTINVISVTTLFTTIDVANYDNAGVITAIGGPNASSQNMRVFMFNSGFISVQYGQQIYSSLSNAQAGIVAEGFIVEPFTIENGVLIAVISVRRDATDLSDPSQATIFSASKFGEVSIGAGGTATSNLQNVYDNSTQPQTVLTALLGGIQIRDAATPIAAPLFQVLDSGGNNIFTVEDPDITINGNLTISDTGNRPGLVLEGFNSAEGDIAYIAGDALQIGSWNGTTFVDEVGILNNNFYVKNDLEVTGQVQGATSDITGLAESGSLTVTGLAQAGSVETDAIQSTTGDTGTVVVTASNITVSGSGQTDIHINDTAGQEYKIWSRNSDNSMGFYDVTNADTFLRYFGKPTFSDAYFEFETEKEATSRTSASSIFRGGIGVSKKIWAENLETTADVIVGGDVNVSGNITGLIISDDFKVNDTLVVMANNVETEMTAPTFSVTTGSTDDMVDIDGFWQIDSSGATSVDNENIYHKVNRHHTYTTSDSTLSQDGTNVIITTTTPHGMVTGAGYFVRSAGFLGPDGGFYQPGVTNVEITINSTTQFQYAGTSALSGLDDPGYLNMVIEFPVCIHRTNGDTDGGSGPNAYFQNSVKYAERLPEVGREFTYIFYYYNFQGSYEIAVGSTMRITCLRRAEFTSSKVTFA